MTFFAAPPMAGSRFADLTMFPPVLNAGVRFGISRTIANGTTVTTMSNYPTTTTTTTNNGNNNHNHNNNNNNNNNNSPTSSSGPGRWGCGQNGCHLDRRIEDFRNQLNDSEARMTSLIEQGGALPSNLEANCRDALSEAEGRYLGVAAYARKCNMREALCCLIAMLTRQKKLQSNKEMRLRKHVEALKETFEEVGGVCRVSAVRVGMVLDEARQLMKQFEAPWRVIREAKKGLDDICPDEFGCSLADQSTASEEAKRRVVSRKRVGRLLVRAEVFRSRNSDFVQKLRERAMGLYLMEGKCMRIAQSLRRAADEPDLKRMSRELKAWADEMEQEKEELLKSELPKSG